jgi:hypothetical protein
MRDHTQAIRWIYDLTLAIRYIGYTSGSGKAKIEEMFDMLFAEEPANGGNSDDKPRLENALRVLFKEPDSDDGLDYQGNVSAWLEAREDLNPFHWELEFPGVFAASGFDAVLANPPFIGSQQQLKHFDNKDIIYFIREYFTGGNAPDYSGFFFHRYAQITNEMGTVGSLATNSIAQASNRDYVMKPLTYSDSDMTESPVFYIVRAVPNDTWPGEANVHYSAVLLSRQPVAKATLVRPTTAVTQPAGLPLAVDKVSSFLDEYPDFDLKPLLSDVPGVIQGFILRGNFSIHRGPNEDAFDAIEQVPQSERDALAAYINTRVIQQERKPKPVDVVVDYYDILKGEGLHEAEADEQLAWLQENYPTTLEYLQKPSPHAPNDEPVRQTRQELSGDSSSYESFKEKWWLFGPPNVGLRAAWKDVEQVVAFSYVSKVWSPLILRKWVEVGDSDRPLRLCPMHSLYVAPAFSIEHLAVVSSFFVEMFVRRTCSSLETRLRFSPTDVFPYLPWPWEPEVDGHRLTIGEPPDEMKKALEEAAEHLLELRTDILEHPNEHGLTRKIVGGPTDLYNLYDSDPDGADALEGADAAGVQKLRQAHVALLDAVLRAYGWHDLADETRDGGWGFEHPWLDRSQRFVPPEPVRAELFVRIDQLNSERYFQELDILGERVLGVVAEAKRTPKQHYLATLESGLELDRETFDLVMEHLYEKALVIRSGTSGNSNWWKK